MTVTEAVVVTNTPEGLASERLVTVFVTEASVCDLTVVLCVNDVVEVSAACIPSVNTTVTRSAEI